MERGADPGYLGSDVRRPRTGKALDHFERIFETLDRTGIRYVVVGGVAVNLHGHQRFTKDLDLALELEGEELLEALNALRDDGYRPSLPVSIDDFADASTWEEWIRETNLQVFQMYHDERRVTVDIVVSIPVGLDDLWTEAVEVSLTRTTVRVASLQHLIRMKRHAGRPQDLAEVEALETIRELLAEEGEMSAGGEARSGSYAAAREFQLRMSLRATPLERLRDLEAMIDFNTEVEARNPRIRRIADAFSALSDTDAATAARMDAFYRKMSPAEKLQRVRDLTETANRLALAGLRARHPDDPAEVLLLRLARIRLGRELFDRAYPGALEAHGG